MQHMQRRACAGRSHRLQLTACVCCPQLLVLHSPAHAIRVLHQACIGLRVQLQRSSRFFTRHTPCLLIPWPIHPTPLFVFPRGLQVYVSYGGLLMQLTGDPKRLEDLDVDQNIYLLCRKVA